MTVSKGRKCTLLHCHAGCRLNDILRVAGLKKQDLFYESESYGTDWKRYIERREKRKIEAVYNYVSSVTGAYAFTKIRLEGKQILYGILVSECLIKSDQNLAAKDVYEKYSQWCNDCGLGIDGRTSFYEELKTKNLLSKTGTVTGKTVKNVVKGYSFVDEVFQSVENNLETPFT